MEDSPAANPEGKKLTVRIIIGLVLGLMVGIAINLLSPPPQSEKVTLEYDTRDGQSLRINVEGGTAVSADGEDVGSVGSAELTLKDAEIHAEKTVTDWNDTRFPWIHSVFSNGLFLVVGQAFVRLLQVIVIPLVFVSLVCGTASLSDLRQLGRLASKTVGLYLFTTAVAISIAMVAALVFQPGRNFSMDVEVDYAASEAPGLVQTLIDIFPRNIFESMSEGKMLPLIVFAILIGLAMVLSGAPGKRLLDFFKDLDAVVMKLVWVIMAFAPFGVFALIARTFATQGFDAFAPLLKYFFLVLGVLLLHGFVTYPGILRVFSGLSIRQFLRKIRQVHLFAFSTASSNATIPISLETVENRLGVKNSVASFTIPLGATINMDGTAIMQGVATVFLAQVYGVDLSVVDLLMVVLTATLASIGTAGVPGVGLIMLSMVLIQVNIPVVGIGLILGIDRLLDMVRTAVNVTGDCVVTCVVANSEGALERAVFDDTEN